MSNFDRIASQARKALRDKYLEEPITRAEFFGQRNQLRRAAAKTPDTRFTVRLSNDIGEAVRLVKKLSNDSIPIVRIISEGTLDKCLQLSQYLSDPAERELVKDAVNKARRTIRTDRRFLTTAEARAQRSKQIKEGKARAEMEQENAKLIAERNKYEVMLKAAGMLNEEDENES